MDVISGLKFHMDSDKNVKNLLTPKSQKVSNKVERSDGHLKLI